MLHKYLIYIITYKYNSSSYPLLYPLFACLRRYFFDPPAWGFACRCATITQLRVWLKPEEH
jgi:hypothetical protein